jgi:hypothetical protein
MALCPCDRHPLSQAPQRILPDGKAVVARPYACSECARPHSPPQFTTRHPIQLHSSRRRSRSRLCMTTRPDLLSLAMYVASSVLESIRTMRPVGESAPPWRRPWAAHVWRHQFATAARSRRSSDERCGFCWSIGCAHVSSAHGGRANSSTLHVTVRPSGRRGHRPVGVSFEDGGGLDRDS